MSGKLIKHRFSVDKQQAGVIVDECTKAFNYTYFRYYPEKNEISCLSIDAQQIQDVKAKVKLIKEKFSILKDPNKKLVSVNLLKLSRRVTSKYGSIIEE